MRHIIPAAVGLIGLATMVVAEEIAPMAVSFQDDGAIDTPLTGQPGDPVAGQQVMSTRGLGNCVACHQVSGLDAAFQGNIGPSLDGTADRWNVAQLRGIVVNAKMVFPDTMMPSFYKSTGYIRPGDAFTGKPAESDVLAPLLTAQQVEDVVAYLATLTE